MTLAAVLGYLFAGTLLGSAIYAAFSRDLLRVSIAFFIELASVGGVLLSLNADYLALVVFSIGIMGTMLVVSFSTIVMGSLKDSFRDEAETAGRRKFTRFFGMALGLFVGVAIGWAFLTAPFLEVASPPAPTTEADVQLLGRMLLGDQLAVFELLGVLVLLVVLGTGLLLRKPNDAN